MIARVGDRGFSTVVEGTRLRKKTAGRSCKNGYVAISIDNVALLREQMEANVEVVLSLSWRLEES